MPTPVDVALSIIKERVLMFKTQYPDDENMHRLFAAHTMGYVKRCLLCNDYRRSRLKISGIHIPDDRPEMRDELTGKRLVFGYSLCSKHYEETEEAVERYQKRIEELYEKRLEDVRDGFIVLPPLEEE